MTGDAQLGLLGGETLLDDLNLPPNLRLLAERERRLSSPLTVLEAGQILHARRGKHPEDGRSDFCIQDGAEALHRLREAQKRQ